MEGVRLAAQVKAASRKKAKNEVERKRKRKAKAKERKRKQTCMSLGLGQMKTLLHEHEYVVANLQYRGGIVALRSTAPDTFLIAWHPTWCFMGLGVAF